MKTLFTIGDRKNATDVLLLEIGQDHCCYGFLDAEEGSFGAIGYHSFDEWEIETGLAGLLEKLAETGSETVVVCSAFEQALLVPQKLFQEGYSLPSVLYDAPFQKQLHDTVSEWQVVTAYLLPRPVHEALLAAFPHSRFFHVYTPALKIGNGYSEPEQLDIHFSTRYFRVLVKKEGQVILAQIYAYKTPLDVVYYLLKICYEFGLNQAGIHLVVSGLIDRDSALYEELHQYFLKMDFARDSRFHAGDEGHPPYYFTSLYNLAACVS